MTSPTVVDLLGAQLARTPDHPAVEDGTRRWTYRELHDAVDTVARRLQRDGVRPGDAVGVGVARSIEAVATVLGVLRTGAAYVPLDLTYPASRLEYMCETAGVDRIAVEAAGLPPFRHQARLVDVWSDRPGDRSGRPDGPSDVAIDPASAGLRALHLGVDRSAQGRPGGP